MLRNRTHLGPVNEAVWNNHTIDELPMVCCFYCGEHRVKRLIVTIIRFWGPAYRCQSPDHCRERKRQGHSCPW